MKVDIEAPLRAREVIMRRSDEEEGQETELEEPELRWG